MPTEATTSATKVILGCSKCGAALPDEAEFCLKCGKPMTFPAKELSSTRKPVRPKTGEHRRKRRIFAWVLVGLLLGIISWVVISDDPFAQGVQGMVGLKHDDAIIQSKFSVSPNRFRYYKFSVPDGQANVSIVGQFSATPENQAPKASEQSSDGVGDIEVYVLSEPAFDVWQNGYATSSVYESGRVAKGELQAELSSGPGDYYLIFSNKFSQKTSTNIDASVFLRYKSWVPEALRRFRKPTAGRLITE